jgi:hypothetical protein
MLNSLLNVTFTLTLFRVYLDTAGIDYHPSQFGWAQYGIYGNGVLDNLIAMAPNGDDNVIAVAPRVAGFIEFIHSVVPSKAIDNDDFLFRGIFSQFDRVKPFAPIVTISKMFRDPEGSSQPIVTRSPEKILRHVGNSNKVGETASRMALLISALVNLNEVPSHSQARTREILLNELKGVQPDSRKIAKLMRTGNWLI